MLEPWESEAAVTVCRLDTAFQPGGQSKLLSLSKKQNKKEEAKT